MIDIVSTLTDGEIHYVDRIDLAHLAVVVAYLNVVGYNLRHAVEHAVEIGQLATVLYLDNHEFATFVLDKHVHTVKLVRLVGLVSLALKETHYGEPLAKERGHQSFQHGVVCLVAKKALHCPVKSYIVCHITIIFCKNTTFPPNRQKFRHFFAIT